MRNVMLPTDFSPNAQKAIDYAQALFKGKTTTFHLVNVMDGAVPYGTTGIGTKRMAEAINTSLLEQSQEGLEQTMAHLKAQGIAKEHTFVPLSLRGSFLETLQKAIVEKDIHYVVMGTKGASGLKEVALGSNTSSLLGKVLAAVLAVPEQITFQSIDEMVFATDYEVDYSEKGLKPLLDLRRDHNARISVLFLDEQQKGLSGTQITGKTYLQTLLKDENSDFFELDGVGVATGARLFTKSRRADLLCLVAKKHNKLLDLFRKSETKGMVNHADVPILVLNQANF
jgi:nucleotide-binding universal stress UspA family protein